MAKNIERAKNFQRTLLDAAGVEWSEEKFNDQWVFSPLGDDWDQWKRLGLMPIDFCPLCGDDNLKGGTTITKAFSAENVQISFCAVCSEINRDMLPPSRQARKETILGCLIIMGVLSIVIVGALIYLFR